MKHVHFFQWNIPADNQLCGETNRYINIMAEWEGAFYNSGKPIVFCQPINVGFAELIIVNNWLKAKKDIEACAEQHFANIAREEKIAQARATLIAEGEPIGCPTLDRFAETEKDLLVQQTLS